jgi:predicted permease
MVRERWRRWRRVFRLDPAEEVDRELEQHLEQRVRDYVARGMSPADAKRAAHQRLGDLGHVREECKRLLEDDRRAKASRYRVNVSWLDVKLGLRMLAKYPGLSIIAVVGMAVAIAVGTGYFAFIGDLMDPVLPLDEGDRIVSVRNRDIARPGRDGLQFAHDYALWRDALASVNLGAFRTVSRNLITEDGATHLVAVAEMTASGFTLARVPAMLGRPLLEEDQLPGAPSVVVIGYDEWQRRFEGEPDIIDTTVRLGETVHTVIGVMPEGFLFPVNHRFWVPLRLDAIAGPGEGGSLDVFGRLADGFTLGEARAELTTVGRRVAATYPETHEQLRPQIMPYTWGYIGFEGPEMALAFRAIQIAIGLLLVIVAVNVSILVYARTATRLGEILVRSALGASRRRVVSQLFVEAMVLSATAAVIGLVLAGAALRITENYIRGGLIQPPFWLDFGLSAGVVIYATILAILAAGIVGVVPALKATGKRLQAGLQQVSGRGSSLQLGGVWTALIVLQVGVAVAALPATVNMVEQSLRLGTNEPAAAANDMLRANIVVSEDAVAGKDAGSLELLRARYADRTIELMRRLEAEPQVAAVTVAGMFPGTESGPQVEIEPVNTGAGSPVAGSAGAGGNPVAEPAAQTVHRRWTRRNRVAPDLFDVFDVPVLAGRGFTDADALTDATVIVNETFATRIGGGANVLGRRIREVRGEGDEVEFGPWLEIIGVVPEFGTRFISPSSFDGAQPSIYQATTPDRLDQAVLVVRVRGGQATAFAARLRDLAAAVDPTLTLERLQSVGTAYRGARMAFWYTGLGIIGGIISVLLLSAAGIYAMMSFTVARRRREIGIRSALGADPRRILTGVFARASAQLGAGIAAGLTIAAAFEWIGPGGTLSGRGAVLLPAVSALMLVVGLAAALGPARRGLSVQPTEALREE